MENSSSERVTYLSEVTRLVNSGKRITHLAMVMGHTKSKPWLPQLSPRLLSLLQPHVGGWGGVRRQMAWTILRKQAFLWLLPTLTSQGVSIYKISDLADPCYFYFWTNSFWLEILRKVSKQLPNFHLAWWKSTQRSQLRMRVSWGGRVLLKDDKISRIRGRGLLGCPSLREFPSCTIRKMCASVWASCFTQDAIICQLLGFSSASAF